MLCTLPRQVPSTTHTGSLKVIIITDVKVHIESLSVAVSIRSEDIFVERPIYTDGWRRGGKISKTLEAAKATHLNPGVPWPTVSFQACCLHDIPLSDNGVEPPILASSGFLFPKIL